MIKVALVRGSYLNNFEGQNYFVKELNDIQLCITGIGSLRSIHQNLPFEVIRLPSLSDINIIGRWGRAIANRTLGDIQNLFGLEKYASVFDIFHTADPHYYYSYQLAKLRRENKIKKLIVTSWETIPHNNETVFLKKRNKYFVLKNADHFICYTEKAKRCLIKENVEENKISVVRLGVDLRRFQTLNLKNQISRQIQILFVGRLVPEKGIWDIYEAYKNVLYSHSKPEKVTLRFIGEGAEKNKLLKQIKKDDLDHVVSVENRPYEEMPEIYGQADIFVAPSKKTSTWEEQYGMVFVEAMAAGLPIISYDTGAIEEVVGKAGILCKENDVLNLTKSLHHLISYKSERLKLGTIGKERATNLFDSKKTGKELKHLYFSLLYG